jgi:hypothetical protein
MAPGKCLYIFNPFKNPVNTIFGLSRFSQKPLHLIFLGTMNLLLFLKKEILKLRTLMLFRAKNVHKNNLQKENKEFPRRVIDLDTIHPNTLDPHLLKKSLNHLFYRNYR